MNECRLELPQATIEYPYALPEKQHLLVIGGRPPAVEWLRQAAVGRIPWAIDHGIDICQKAGIRPEHLLGDRDSASKEAWEWGSSFSAATDTYPSEKDFTDTQLALEKLPPTAFAIVTGAFGGRFDHAFANIFSCANAKPSCCLADEQELLVFLKGDMEIQVTCQQEPLAISLLPLTAECSGVTISGVHWPLKDATLHQHMPNTISNVPEGKKGFPVALKRGILGIYLCFCSP